MILNRRQTTNNTHQHLVLLHFELIAQYGTLVVAFRKLIKLQSQTDNSKLFFASNAEPIVYLCSLLLSDNYYPICRHASQKSLDEEKETSLDRSIVAMKYMPMVGVHKLAWPSFTDERPECRPTI